MTELTCTRTVERATQRSRGIFNLLKRAERDIESRISGTSMAGTLPDGARIRIRTTSRNEYIEGQIVACLRGRSLVAHRIVFRGRGRLRNIILTMGDGWILCDRPAALDSVLGIVEAYWTDGEWRSPVSRAQRSRLRQWRATLSVTLTVAMMYVTIEVSEHFVSALLKTSEIFNRIRRTVTGKGMN